jgi:hypothetical protein
MRPSGKSKLSQHLKDKVAVLTSSCSAENLVIDGGWLMHQISWTSSDSFSSIGTNYVNFVKRKACSRTTVVVFDGYESSPKDHEHKRRSKDSIGCSEIRIIPTKPCPVTKAKFLSNNVNKSKFITYICELLQNVGINTSIARDDADTLVVKKALQLSSSNNKSVEIIAEDTDILILLLHHSITCTKPLFFTTQNGSYNIMELYEKLSPSERQRLLFMHSLTGCDTVSSLFGHGKPKLLTKTCKPSIMIDEIFEALLIINIDQEIVVDNGVLLLQHIYGNINKSLKDLRLQRYNKMTTVEGKTLKPEYLPPTEGAARQHVLRAYLQYHDWSLLSSMTLPPTEYGWQIDGDGLFEPIGTLVDIAPAALLKVTACNCTRKGNCVSTKCSCRSQGLLCIQACGNCNGVDCTNVAV